MDTEIEPEFECVRDVIQGMGRAGEQGHTVKKFALFVCLNVRLNRPAISLSEDCFRRLVVSCGMFDVRLLRKDKLKEGSVLAALWIVFLRLYKEAFPVTADSFKYKGLPAFLSEYEGCFNALSVPDQKKLLLTANWMGVLLKHISPRGNKGFYMQVVPKFLEGFDARFTLGTGQPKSTTFRERIFEHEGEIKAARRKQFSHSNRRPTELERLALGGMFSDESLISPAHTYSSDSSEPNSVQSAKRQRVSAPSAAPPTFSAPPIFSALDRLAAVASAIEVPMRVQEQPV